MRYLFSFVFRIKMGGLDILNFLTCNLNVVYIKNKLTLIT